MTRLRSSSRYRHEHDLHPVASVPAPGKRTLTATIQRATAGGQPPRLGPPPALSAAALPAGEDPFWFCAGTPTETVEAAAAHGIASPSTSLPHRDAIAASFGHHDVGAIQAHVGGEAAAAARAMGATAFATGNHVVLADSSLHTVAHEAAHVVQQRAGVSLAGGVGRTGDPYEKHADAVADAVVRGESAEPLLDELAGAGAASAAVQRKIEVNAAEGPNHEAMAALYKILATTSDGPDRGVWNEVLDSEELTLVLAWRDSTVVGEKMVGEKEDGEKADGEKEVGEKEVDDELGSTYASDGGARVWITIDRSLNWLLNPDPHVQPMAQATMLHEFNLHALPLISSLKSKQWTPQRDTEDEEHGNVVGWTKTFTAAAKVGAPVVFEVLCDAIAHCHHVGADRPQQKTKLQGVFLRYLPAIAKEHGLAVETGGDDLLFVIDEKRMWVTALVRGEDGVFEAEEDEKSKELLDTYRRGKE